MTKGKSPLQFALAKKVVWSAAWFCEFWHATHQMYSDDGADAVGAYAERATRYADRACNAFDDSWHSARRG